MNAELVFDRMRTHVVALAAGHNLGHQKQGNAFGARRCIGQTGENEMDDVVGQVMLTIGYENF